MFFSRLVLNPRCRQARRDMANPYDMHRSLLTAFAHRSDGGPGRVLWRLDVDRRSGQATVLVQSEQQPVWEPLRESSPYYFQHLGSDAENPATKQRELHFGCGQVLAFRLRANPTVKRDGKRHGWLREDEQLGWLRRKAAAGGFSLLRVQTTPEGTVSGRKSHNGRALSFVSVRFDGLLRVADAEQLLEAVRGGVGSGKGFGFGLLSLARYVP